MTDSFYLLTVLRKDWQDVSWTHAQASCIYDIILVSQKERNHRKAIVGKNTTRTQSYARYIWK